MSLSTSYESVVITISHFCRNLFMVYPLINVVRILCFSHNVYHLYSQLMNINTLEIHNFKDAVWKKIKIVNVLLRIDLHDCTLIEVLVVCNCRSACEMKSEFHLSLVICTSNLKLMSLLALISQLYTFRFQLVHFTLLKQYLSLYRICRGKNCTGFLFSCKHICHNGCLIHKG